MFAGVREDKQSVTNNSHLKANRLVRGVSIPPIGTTHFEKSVEEVR